LQLHLPFGISIGVLVLLRIIWRLVNIQPSKKPGTRLEHKPAKVGHYLPYAIMIAMPVTGYLGKGVVTEFFFLFDIAKFPDTWGFTYFIE
jgi:cytochrome b561